MSSSDRFPASGLSLALRLHALDRWPTLVSSNRVWQRLRFAEPFDYRWNNKPVPTRAQRVFDLIAATEQSTPVNAAKRALHRRTAKDRLDQGLLIDHCNAGPLGRMSNSAQTAVAVDAQLNGAPATAMPWGIGKDPVRLFKLGKVLEGAQIGQAIATPEQLERLVQSWGPGSKGVVSLRDPAHAFHRVFNVVNSAGVVEFFDYSRSAPVNAVGQIGPGEDAQARATQALTAVDARSPFAGIQVWRTRNCAGASPLPDNLLTLGRIDALAAITQVLPKDFPQEQVVVVLDRLQYLGDMHYAHTLVQQINDGASTLLPHHIEALAKRSGEMPTALTAMDETLIAFGRAGHISVQGTTLEITIPDTPEFVQLAQLFVGHTVRRGDIDGLAPGTFEICLDGAVLERRRVPSPQYAAPGSIQVPQPNQRVAGRRTSWIEANRVASPGTRATNCWNCAASTVEWIISRSPSTGLPVYEDAPYRPQIAEYLETIGATGPTVFVETLAEAEAVARSWGPWKHGLVVCSLTKDSTHIFNVVHSDNQVRFLDGHMGRDGAYNFDTDWMRIGVVELGSWNL